MDRISYRLADPQRANQVLRDVWSIIKPLLMSGRVLALDVRSETRSTAQNRLLHARFNDIAKQIEWVGKRRDVDTWKRLLTAAWLRARGESVELLPAVDGHGVDVVFRRTSTLTTAECAELSDYVMAWGDGEGVRWSQTSLGRDWPQEFSK